MSSLLEPVLLLMRGSEFPDVFHHILFLLCLPETHRLLLHIGSFAFFALPLMGFIGDVEEHSILVD